MTDKTIKMYLPLKYRHRYFRWWPSQKKKRRSQHVKEQERPESTVNQVPLTPIEDGTEVLQEEEELKPSTEGTGIPYEARSIQSTINTHTTTIKSYPDHNHKNIKCILCHFGIVVTD